MRDQLMNIIQNRPCTRHVTVAKQSKVDITNTNGINSPDNRNWRR